MNRGIIVGCDAKLEYLLPYFYLNLRLNSDLPIVFFDFGMSVFGSQFCQKRGEVILIENSLNDDKCDTLMDTIRHAWFKKPLAFIQSPFDLTLWLDLDCKILKPIDLIFDELPKDKWIAAYEETFVDDAHNVLNSGVVVYRKNAPFLNKWIHLAGSENHRFFGDQDALTESLKGDLEWVQKLDQKFNNIFYSCGYNKKIQSIIIHHVGAFKCLLQKEYLIIEKSPIENFQPCIEIDKNLGNKTKFLKAELA